MYSLVLVICKFVSCSSRPAPMIDVKIQGGLYNGDTTEYTESIDLDNIEPGCGKTDQNVMVVFLLIESILFGLFTLCMMGDQSTVLSSNQTAIDKLKGYKHEQEGLPDFNEVFGGSNDVKFRFDWLLPIPMRYPDTTTIKDRLLGYRVPDRREKERERERERERNREKEVMMDLNELSTISYSSPAEMDVDPSKTEKGDRRRRSLKTSSSAAAVTH